MKKLLAILTVSLASLPAFAQGRIRFENDSLHLVYYNPAVYGPPLGGMPVTLGNAPYSVADLYIGTSSSSLSLISTTTFSTTPGEWSAASVIVPTIPGGTTVFIKIQVRNAAFAAESTWTPSFVPPDVFWGFSVEFPFTLGSSVTYPSIVAPPPPWPPGNFPIPGYGYGAIPVGYVPEPSAVALAGLAVGAMLFFRNPSKRQNGKTAKLRISVRVTVTNGN